VVWVGALIGALALGVGYFYWRMDANGPWQTMVFATLGFAQLGQAFASRALRQAQDTALRQAQDTALRQAPVAEPVAEPVEAVEAAKEVEAGKASRRQNLNANRPGLVIALITFLLQLAALYLPFLQSFFGTQPLAPFDLGLSMVLGLVVFMTIEAARTKPPS
jgi:Ca2+-transporting ATPase